MPTAAGFILSTFLGAVTRRVQLNLVGRLPSGTLNSVGGYALSVSAFIGGYLVSDHFIERNRDLLGRRLTQLREQRAQAATFHEFDLEADHRITAAKRESKFFELLDKYGKSYK